MQRAPCNKCKSGFAAPGDSWCLACSSHEVTFAVLKRRWNNPGLRGIAEETVLSAARLVKAFSNVDANLVTSAAVDKHPWTAPKGKPEKPRERSPPEDERPPLSRRTSSSYRAWQPESPKEADYDRDSEYTEESEEEEEESRPDPPVAPPPPPKAEVKEEHRGSQRPPEPANPPREKESHAEHRRSDDRDKKKKKKKKNKKRGGSRHQRHYRETAGPLRSSHRRLDSSHLRLASSFEEGFSRRA